MFEVKKQIGKSELVFRTGEYGAQADSCITVQYGKTVVLCAAVDGGIKEGMDFMPMLVDYRERFYAAGKILGSRFVRRESKPRDHEILIARMMDRSVRPTFPKGYTGDTQLSAILLSSDGENPIEPIAVNAAMLSLSLSGIPITIDLACARVAKIGEELVVFPTCAELAQARFEILVSCSREKILMIGDALGDLKAARDNQALFYPINPGAEEESWKRFRDEALGRFFAGTYAGAYEQERVAEFDSRLPETPPWRI